MSKAQPAGQVATQESTIQSSIYEKAQCLILADILKQPATEQPAKGKPAANAPAADAQSINILDSLQNIQLISQAIRYIVENSTEILQSPNLETMRTFLNTLNCAAYPEEQKKPNENTDQKQDEQQQQEVKSQFSNVQLNLSASDLVSLATGRFLFGICEESNYYKKVCHIMEQKLPKERMECERTVQSVMQTFMLVLQRKDATDDGSLQLLQFLTEQTERLGQFQGGAGPQSKRVILHIETKPLLKELVMQLAINLGKQGKYVAVADILRDNIDYGNSLCLRLWARACFQILLSGYFQEAMESLYAIINNNQLSNQDSYSLSQYIAAELSEIIKLAQYRLNEHELQELAGFSNYVLISFQERVKENSIPGDPNATQNSNEPAEQLQNDDILKKDDLKKTLSKAMQKMMNCVGLSQTSGEYVYTCYTLLYVVYTLTNDVQIKKELIAQADQILSMVKEYLKERSENEQPAEPVKVDPKAKAPVKIAPVATMWKADKKEVYVYNSLIQFINVCVFSGDIQNDKLEEALQLLKQISKNENNSETEQQQEKNISFIISSMQEYKIQIKQQKEGNTEDISLQKMFQQVAVLFLRSEYIQFCELAFYILKQLASEQKIVNLEFKGVVILLKMFKLLIKKNESVEVIQQISELCKYINCQQIMPDELYQLYRRSYFNYDVDLSNDIYNFINEIFWLLKISRCKRYASNYLFKTIITSAVSQHQTILSIQTFLQYDSAKQIYSEKIVYNYAVLLSYYYVYANNYQLAFKFAQIFYLYAGSKEIEFDREFLNINLRILVYLYYQPKFKVQKQIKQDQLNLIEKYIQANKDVLYNLYVRYNFLKCANKMYIQNISSQYTTIFEQEYLQQVILQFIQDDIEVDKFMKHQLLLTQQQHILKSSDEINENLLQFYDTILILAEQEPINISNIQFLIFILLTSQSYYYEDIVTNSTLSQVIACKFLCKSRKFYIAYKLIKILLKINQESTNPIIHKDYVEQYQLLQLTLLEQLLYMYRHTPHYFLINTSMIQLQDLKSKVQDKIVNRYLLEADQSEKSDDFCVKHVILSTHAKLNIYQLSEEFVNLAIQTLKLEVKETNQEGIEGENKAATSQLQQYINLFRLSSQELTIPGGLHGYVYSLYLSILQQNESNVLEIISQIGGKGIERLQVEKPPSQTTSRPPSTSGTKKQPTEPQAGTQIAETTADDIASLNRQIQQLAILLKGGKTTNAELTKENIKELLNMEEFKLFDSFINLLAKVLESQLQEADIQFVYAVKTYFSFKADHGVTIFPVQDQGLLLLYQKLIQLTQFSFLDVQKGLENVLLPGVQQQQVTLDLGFAGEIGSVLNVKYQSIFQNIIQNAAIVYSNVLSQLQTTEQIQKPSTDPKAKGKPEIITIVHNYEFYSIVSFDTYSVYLQMQEGCLQAIYCPNINISSLERSDDATLNIQLYAVGEPLGEQIMEQINMPAPVEIPVEVKSENVEKIQSPIEENINESQSPPVFLLLGNLNQTFLIHRIARYRQIIVLVQTNLKNQISTIPSNTTSISTLFDPLHDVSYAETIYKNFGISKEQDAIFGEFKHIKNLQDFAEITQFFIQSNSESSCLITFSDQGEIFAQNITEVVKDCNLQEFKHIEAVMDFSKERSERWQAEQLPSTQFLAQNLHVSDQIMVLSNVQRVQHYSFTYEELCENLLKVKKFQKNNQAVSSPEKGAKGKVEAKPTLLFTDVFGEPRIQFIGMQPKEEAKAGKK